VNSTRLHSATAIVYLCVISAAPAQTISDKTASDQVEMVSADDPAMANAFRNARETLDTFLDRVIAKDKAITMPSLKVRIVDGDAVEYFWISPFRVTTSGLVGTIDNDPETVHNVRNHQELTIKKSDVYDWSYVDRSTGKMIGNFTACAILTHQPPEEARAFKKQYGLNCQT
jgi:uncharacterized protein YegJ (DUF2314 family)